MHIQAAMLSSLKGRALLAFFVTFAVPPPSRGDNDVPVVLKCGSIGDLSTLKDEGGQFQ